MAMWAAVAECLQNNVCWIMLLTAFLLYITHWVRVRRCQHSVFSRLGIPHVPPHLVYGSNHLLRSPALATEVIGQWVKQYGKVFGYYVGWRPMLVVSDLDLIKQILIKDFHNFTNRPKLVINAPPVMDTVVGLRDQRWKDVRSILAPTFSMLKMKHMTGIINEKINVLMNIVGEKCSRGEPVEWYTTFQGLTLDVISDCVLAIKSNCQWDQEKDEFLRAVREFLQNAVNPGVLLAVYLPVFASFMSFVSNRLAISGRMTHMIVEHLKAVIAVRRGDLGRKYVDVLQLMLEASELRPVEAVTGGSVGKEREEGQERLGVNKKGVESKERDGSWESKVDTKKRRDNECETIEEEEQEMKEREEETGKRKEKRKRRDEQEKTEEGKGRDKTTNANKHRQLTDDEVIANAWVFMLGGFETTASTLTYTTYLLATHPHIQERLYREMCASAAVTKQDDDILTGTPLTYEEVRQLTFLDQVLSESLRLYPPIVTFLTRESADDFQIGDLKIPRDMNILVPIWQIHRDPEQWPNPDTFDPDRFSLNTKGSESRHPMAYLPFGAGPRSCPGMRFAQLEAKLTIARIIQSYSLEVCEGTPQPLTFKIPTVAINPAQKVLIKAVPRK